VREFSPIELRAGRGDEATWADRGRCAAEREARHSRQHDKEPKQHNEPFDALAKIEDFLLKSEEVHFEDVNGDNVGASRGEPAASRGARNTSPSCVSDVTRRSDKIAEAMIVSAQESNRGSHDSIITAIASTATPDGTDTA
jgi:hypothetical protein